MRTKRGGWWVGILYLVSAAVLQAAPAAEEAWQTIERRIPGLSREGLVGAQLTEMGGEQLWEFRLVAGGRAQVAALRGERHLVREGRLPGFAGNTHPLLESDLKRPVEEVRQKTLSTMKVPGHAVAGYCYQLGRPGDGEKSLWRVMALNGSGAVLATMNLDGGTLALRSIEIGEAAVAGAQPRTDSGPQGEKNKGFAGEVESTFKGIGGELEQFFTGERTIDR